MGRSYHRECVIVRTSLYTYSFSNSAEYDIDPHHSRRQCSCISFEGEHLDLTSKSTAYIGYGGSYAGAFNAFLRVQYPDIFWGTISSSGVTKAIYDYWAYYEPVAQYGPPACIAAQKAFTKIVDNIIIGKNDTKLTATLKNAFGLGNLTHNADFANE